MKRIHYADDELVTGDDIADAVMAYARALALRGRSDSVDVPGLDEQGVERRFQILVGPASQMLTSDHDVEGDEVVDADLVADLGERTLRLSAPSPRSVPVGEDVVGLDSDEHTSGPGR